MARCNHQLPSQPLEIRTKAEHTVGHRRERHRQVSCCTWPCFFKHEVVEPSHGHAHDMRVRVNLPFVQHWDLHPGQMLRTVTPVLRLPVPHWQAVPPAAAMVIAGAAVAP